jgi:hypothetical protein
MLALLTDFGDAFWCAQYRRLLGGEKYEPKEEARLDAW